MRYSIYTHKKVDKFIAKHPEIKNKFFQKFEEISISHSQNSCDTKPLIGKPNHYRLRIGKYRFLYEIIENKILIYIYDSDSRGSIYK